MKEVRGLVVSSTEKVGFRGGAQGEGAKHTPDLKGIRLFLCPPLFSFPTWKSAGPRVGP